MSAFALLCGGLPLWLLTLVFLLFKFQLNLDGKYLIYLAVWSVLVVTTNLGSLFLMKFRALSELSIYRLAFSAIVAFLIDALILKNGLNPIVPFATTLMFISGFLISQSRMKSNLKLETTLLILFFLSVAGAVQFIVYKSGLLLQEHPLLHSSLAQVIVYTLIFIASYKHVSRDLKAGLITKKDFLTFGILVYIFTTIEAFLFRQLPVILLISLSVLHIIMYQIYDAHTKEIKASWKLYFATCLAIIALLAMRLL